MEPSNPSLIPIVKGHQLARYVKDVYRAKAGIYTRDMLVKLEKDLSSAKPGQLIEIPCMNGGFKTEEVPARPDGPHAEYITKINMLNIHQMVERAETAFASGFLEDEGYRFTFTDEQKTIITCPITFSTVPKNAKQHDLLRLENAWNRGWLNWGGNSVHKALIQSLKTLGPKMPEISKVLCLELGPLGGFKGDLLFAERADDSQARYRSINQHMFAATLAKALSDRFGKRVALMASDPEYTENDKKILSSSGVKIIEGFGALSLTEIDSKTLVVSFNPTFPLKQIICDFAKPAAIIWGMSATKLNTMDQNREGRSSRTRKLGEYYDEYLIAKEPIRFGKINLCIRKPIIDNLANAIETNLVLSEPNGMAKPGCGNTHVDDMDEAVMVDYESEDEWVVLDE
ncbi:unnamed protein product [Clonostachys rosea]|uniref:SRR1-like domain-containing protein n=1 Tax=Bionectria ochroleuca TaxID=29856 RepID=A0ABY6TUI1_BIOOC|nr:unnamed protein product [Clonostachys rosea]